MAGGCRKAINSRAVISATGIGTLPSEVASNQSLTNIYYFWNSVDVVTVQCPLCGLQLQHWSALVKGKLPQVRRKIQVPQSGLRARHVIAA
ncbi:hypothetical protein SAMN05444358_102248 [Ruegeria halocynthiae]|uniref:Uncharacterized protein n=1 Tax=Ruegeria halocynthiae TaxID=985054 RepID=A0A1H2YER4_9RHOB|nr:hypothetical protein SAMN05444358_102248 [Ruegeria halocynthiae]